MTNDNDDTSNDANTGTPPVRVDLDAEKEQRAAAAAARVHSGQHWRDWVDMADGLAVGRKLAMYEASTNRAIGGKYSAAMKRWMNRDPNQWSLRLDNPTRNHLLWTADHLAEIERWRETLASNERARLNHPTSTKRRFEVAHKVAEAKQTGEPEKLSPFAKLQETTRLQAEKIDELERKAQDNGSLFDLRKDKPDDIARVIVGTVTPSRVKAIVAAINKALQKGAQAG